MQVRILKPTKSTMQSGDYYDKWILEFVKAQDGKFNETLMGWTSSKDMMSEVKIEFSSLDEAISYAKSRNYSIEIIEPKKRKFIKKSYASNFILK